jgi:DNA-binding LacI/PurR family transcriptional regulator
VATIGDVAEYAGVARSTVSHALSGKRPVSSATRERINEAIAVLQFTANAGAKALATAKTSTMGLIVPYAPDEFAPARMEYILIVSETARDLGYDVLMVTDVEGKAGIKRVTDSNRVDGLVLMDIKRHDERVASVLAARQPGVLIGIAEDNDSVDSVDLDFAEAGRMLVRHLAEQGHRRVIFITFPERLFAEDLGFVWRLRDSVIAEAARLNVTLTIVYDDADPATRSKLLGKALDDRSETTALLVHSERALVDLPPLLRERGISVPGDLSVVSLFGDEFGKMFSLPFTAIDPAPETVAARAVELLVDRIADPGRPVVRQLVAPVLIDRGSTHAI